MTAQPTTILTLMTGPLVDQNGRPLDRLDPERETRQLRQQLREIDRAATLRVELATPEGIPLEQSARMFEERGLPQAAATVRAALPKVP